MLLFVKVLLWVVYIITVTFFICGFVSDWKKGNTFNSIARLCVIHCMILSLITGTLLTAFTVFVHTLG